MIIEHHKRCFTDPSWVKSLIVAFLLLAASLVVNYYTGTYATTKESNPVTDIVLSNIPVFDVDGIFTYGAFVMVGLIVLLAIRYPYRTPFTVKAISLFYLIRSISVSLTHIAPFPSHAIIDPSSIMRFFNFDGQLFFSGHTGLPLLIALIFWEHKTLRYCFISLSVMFAAVTLMGHLHYSIDVFSAFFITYSIFHLAQVFFKKDAERQFHSCE